MIGFGPYVNYLPIEQRAAFRDQVEDTKILINTRNAEILVTEHELYSSRDAHTLTIKELNSTKDELNSTKINFDFTKQINEELCSMFNNPEFSDFTITIKEKSYYVHKVVLSSHSPVFAAMFRSKMKESHTSNVVIDDCDFDVFEVFLNFLYTGDLTKAKPFSEQLLPLSEKYQIKPLKTICQNYVEIVNDNAIDVLIMSEKYSADKLKDRAVEHIVKNLEVLRPQFTLEFFNDYSALAFSIFGSNKK